MANTSRPYGFSVVDPNAKAVPVRLTSSITCVAGDPLFLGSDGYACITQAAGKFIGIAASKPRDGETSRSKTTSDSTAGTDFVDVYPACLYEFEGQILSGAVTDPYVLTTSCYDMVVSSGASYITNAASTYDTCKITGVASEDNGQKSQPGDYQKVFFRGYNPIAIAGTIITNVPI